MGAEAGILMAGSSLAGAYSQSQAAAAQGDYQKQMANINASLAGDQANDAVRRGVNDANLAEKKAREVRGAQRAALATSGVDVDSGSAAALQESTSTLGHLDALTIRNNAFREAYGYSVQASQYQSQGRMAGLAGQNEARNTLLTGGLKAASYSLDAFDKYKGSDTKKKSMPSYGNVPRISGDY